MASMTMGLVMARGTYSAPAWCRLNFWRPKTSAFLRDGEAALKLSGKGGRYHAYLTEEEEASWLEGFRDAGENGGILEVGRIQAAFEEKVGRKVAKSTVYDLLHRHGWRKITPRPRHPKSDPDAAASFKKTSATS